MAAGCVDAVPIETGIGRKAAARAEGRTRWKRGREKDGNI